MVRVEYDSVTKRYGKEIGAEDINVEIEDGEFAVLLGPSGCGKTTTLRCLAGLIEPSEGEIRLDGKDITDTHPKNRNIAMVFQNLALYPHMNVRENIRYPLKVAGVDKEERDERVRDIAETLEIEELLNKEVDRISGGQAQRVAIGRAIIRRPGVFLMDEPLANLDAKLQVQMRNQIKVLQRELGITTLYVTHDQEEAQTLGDKLIIMNDGRIAQIGTPREVYHEPVNRFVAGFIGSPGMNFLEVQWEGDRLVPAADPDAFSLELPEVGVHFRDHERFEIGVRPKYFQVHTEETDNAIPATVTVTEPTDDDQIITADVATSEAFRELTIIAPGEIYLEPGDEIWLTIDQDLAHGFDLQTGERITGPEATIKQQH
jgi:multiple sugar transport system ATP-binding protein